MSVSAGVQCNASSGVVTPFRSRCTSQCLSTLAQRFLFLGSRDSLRQSFRLFRLEVVADERNAASALPRQPATCCASPSVEHSGRFPRQSCLVCAVHACPELQDKGLQVRRSRSSAQRFKFLLVCRWQAEQDVHADGMRRPMTTTCSEWSTGGAATPLGGLVDPNSNEPCLACWERRVGRAGRRMRLGIDAGASVAQA